MTEIARLFPAAQPDAPRRSPGIPASGAAGGWGVRRPGRSLDEKAITLAVVASVRHEDTDYDSLLMSGVPRDVAREQIKPAIEQVLGAWA